MLLTTLLGLSVAAPVPPARWHTLFDGRLVRVEVERVLYREHSRGTYYVAVRVTNRSPRSLGLDLRDPSRALHVNHWRVHDDPLRALDDELRVVPPAPGEPERDALRRAYWSGELTPLPPGEERTIYLSCAAGAGAGAETGRGRTLLLRLDGSLAVTDGWDAEHLACWRADDPDGVPRELLLENPPRWRWLPRGALVLPPR
jgi:hypothetical protein